MTETQFIEKNQEDWVALERLLKKPRRDADQLNKLFVKVSSDLSYARTFFPNRSVRVYLNNLTQEVFDSMRVKEDRFKFSQISNFFVHILPQEIYNSRKALLVSLVVFSVSVIIGVISTIHDPEFPRLILGDHYVDMTEENIAKGDPMAVYKDERKVDMFFGITTNNIRVSFLAFVLGLFGSVGTLLVLLQNGIMLGSFQYFFATKGLFWTSFLTIWIHGTIEISAIIIAGGAGIVLGNGLLFPSTYKRATSLQVSSLRAMRLILGAVPLFVIAGALESFVTRQTELPNMVKAGIIFASAALIILMWVVYPIYYRLSKKQDVDYNIQPTYQEENQISKKEYRNMSQCVADSFAEFRYYFSDNLRHIILHTLIIFIPAIYLILKYDDLTTNYSYMESFVSLHTYINVKTGGIGFLILCPVLLSYFFCVLKMISRKKELILKSKLQFIKEYYLKVLLAVLLFYLPLAFIPMPYYFLTWFILPPHMLIIFLENIFEERLQGPKFISDSYKYYFRGFLQYFTIYIILLFVFLFITLFQNSEITMYISDYVRWHILFENNELNYAFVQLILGWLMFCFFLIISYYFFSNIYQSQRTKTTARDLKDRLKDFGSHLKISNS